MPTLSNSFCVLQMGFFRRHYREIIEAEKNRKDSDESWDWVQKSQWELGSGSENPISCYLHHDSLLRPSSLPYVEERIFSRFLGGLTLDGDLADVRGDRVACQKRLAVKFHWSQWDRPLASGSEETERETSCNNTSRQLQPSGRCWKEKIYFL